MHLTTSLQRYVNAAEFVSLDFLTFVEITFHSMDIKRRKHEI